MSEITKQDFENLAAMIADGFNAVEVRFTNIDKRLDGIDQRLAVLERQAVGAIRQFENIERRFDISENLIADVKDDIKARDPILRSHGERLDALSAA